MTSSEDLEKDEPTVEKTWEVIKDSATIYEIFSEDAKAAEEEELSPPRRFRDISNGE